MPRSASRDLADRYLGNRRYFRHWNRLERWKMIFSVFALMGVAFWAAYSFANRGGPADYQLTHGPLAKVHAAWDHQCEACHVGQTFQSGSLLDAHGRWTNMTCEKCHAGPSHVDNMKPDYKVNACAECHHDHSGRNFSLTRISDDHCVKCHEKVSLSAAKPPKTANEITAFDNDRGHPEFKRLTNHVRHLKFSHSIHLTPGMVLATGARGAWMLADIEKIAPGRAAEFKPYAEAKTGIIQLNCQACHQPAEAGKLFQPIQFEQHCAACHPTMVPNRVTDITTVLPPFAVPHGKPIPEYDAILKAEFSRLLQTKYPDVLKAPIRKDVDPLLATFEVEVRKATDQAKEVLFSGKQDYCAKCHDIEPGKIVPPNIPTVWFPSVKFNHVAHQSAACIDCHQNAKSMIGTPEHEIEKAKVGIEGMKSCQQCHSPQRVIDGKTLGGIRHNCTDCHTYHQADHPDKRLQFMLGPNKPSVSLEAFLNGKGRE